MALFGVVVRAIRSLARLAFAASIALLGGLVVGVLISPGSAEQLSVSLLTALGLVIPTYKLLRMPRKNEIATPQIAPSSLPQLAPEEAKPAFPTRRRWFRRLQKPNPDNRIEAAWDALAGEAIGSENRVLVARRSCTRLREALKARPLDPHAHDLLVLLEKRVPELIEGRIKRTVGADERQRSLVLEDLLELLERVAAECERRLSRLRPTISVLALRNSGYRSRKRRLSVVQPGVLSLG